MKLYLTDHDLIVNFGRAVAMKYSISPENHKFFNHKGYFILCDALSQEETANI